MKKTETKTGSYAAAVAECLTAYFDAPEETLNDICYDKNAKEFFYGNATGRDTDCMPVWETSYGLGWWGATVEDLEKEFYYGTVVNVRWCEAEKMDWINDIANAIETAHTEEGIFPDE